MIPRFKKSRIEPKPVETDYWVDINENEFGGVFKYYDYNNEVWKQIQTITSEKEPKFTNSPAYKITDRNIVDWNSKASYADFDEFKEEVVYAINKIGTIDTSYIESDILDLKNKLDTKADKNAVPTNLELRRVEDQIPTKVSQLENDSKYITVDEVPELPDSIVSDSNYVHTDNNFTDELKDKLTNLDPDASNYDDTEVRNLIKDNTRLIESNTISIRDNTKNITSIANSIADINSNLNTKANLDDVYTREYLDSLFNTFVRKTHKTYGFCDDRPTDLENEDTGFVFYDYTVNEPIIWVSSEWRILVGNIPLTTVVKDEDVLETIGDWEYVKLNDDFCKLTAFIGDKTNEELDLKVPNLYNTYFALEVGDNDIYTETVVEDKLIKSYDLGWNNRKLLTGEVYPRYSYEYILDERDYYIEKVKNTEKYNDLLNQNITEIYNIFQKPVRTFSYDGLTTTEEVATDVTNINSLTLGQGIKKIKACMFSNFSLNGEDITLKIPSGCNYLGAYAFYNTNINKVEFPVNPLNLSVGVFLNCNIKEVTLPKTLTAEECRNGNGISLFSNSNNPSGIILNLPEGTQAIPAYCFNGSKISNDIDSFPKSIKYVGTRAFYNSNISINSLDTRNIEFIGYYSFCLSTPSARGISNLRISGNTKVLLPYAFYNMHPNVYDYAAPLKKITLEEGIERIYTGGITLNSTNCVNDLHVPGTIESLPPSFLLYYGYHINGTASLDNLVKINITFGEGIKCIMSNAFNWVCTGNTELAIPESVEILLPYAFLHGMLFINKTLHISKNLKYYGKLYNNSLYTLYNKKTRELFLNKKPPYFSKNGYNFGAQPYEYVLDGGCVTEYGSDPFYNCFSRTLEEITCDEENPNYKSVDGVLFTKDGKWLVKYPNITNREDNTYEIPEGVERVYGGAFSRTGELSLYASLTFGVTNPITGESTTITMAAPSVPQTYGCPPEGKGLKNLILSNSFIIETPFEIYEWNIQTLDFVTNSLHNALYFGGVENYLVKEDNPRYKSIDGIIYSKDGTTLIAMPHLKHGNINIPEGVTTINEYFLSETNVRFPENMNLAIYPIDEEDKQNVLDGDAQIYHRVRGDICWALWLKLPSTLVNITDFEVARMNAIFKTFNNKIFVDPANPAFTTNETYTQLIRK